MTKRILLHSAIAAVAFVAGAPSMRAGLLQIQLSGCPETQGTVGPLTASCSTTSGQGQGLANYTTLGASASAGSDQSFTSLAQMFDSVTVGGIPTGTQVDLTFFVQYDGAFEFAGSPPDDATISTTVVLTYGGGANYIIDGGQSLRLCGQSGPGCFEYGSYVADAAPAVTLFSTQVVAVAGTGVPIEIDFSLNVDASGGASVYGDWLDPFTLTNILVTDPTTGLPVAGATITGNSGTSYPVNVVSSAPEPSTWGSFACGIFLIGALRRAAERTVAGSKLTWHKACRMTCQSAEWFGKGDGL